LACWIALAAAPLSGSSSSFSSSLSLPASRLRASSSSGPGPRQRTRCNAGFNFNFLKEVLPDNPLEDVIKATPLAGSVVDPSYWKQQYFLAANFKAFLPSLPKEFCVLELMAGDSRHLGYLAQEKDKSGSRPTRYLLLGELADNTLDKLKFALEKQGEMNDCSMEFFDWEAGREVPELKKGTVDFGLISEGTSARIGLDTLQKGLVEMRRILSSKGRIVIVATKEDEEVFGGSLVDTLAALEMQDLVESEGLGLEESDSTGGQVFQDAGLRLIFARKDEECGLAIGVLIPQAPKVDMPRSRAARRSAQQKSDTATGQRRSRPDASKKGGRRGGPASGQRRGR